MAPQIIKSLDLCQKYLLSELNTQEQSNGLSMVKYLTY